MKNRILIVSPHPDDMEIGMGGTAALMSSTGTEITHVVLTDGRRSPAGRDEDENAAVRRIEAEKAAAVLGISRVEQPSLALLDREAETAIRILTDLIDETSPDEIFVPHPLLDRHQTHRLASFLLTRAARKARFRGEIWAYEVWGVFTCWERFEVIDRFISKKRQAIACHSSQPEAFCEGVLGINRWHAAFSDPHKAPGAFTHIEVFKRMD